MRNGVKRASSLQQAKLPCSAVKSTEGNTFPRAFRDAVWYGKYGDKETFTNSAVDTVRILFGQVSNDIGTQPGAMSIDEEPLLIQKTKKSGIFRFTGAVGEVVRLMDVTKCTVYNYLKKFE